MSCVAGRPYPAPLLLFLTQRQFYDIKTVPRQLLALSEQLAII